MVVMYDPADYPQIMCDQITAAPAALRLLRMGDEAASETVIWTNCEENEEWLQWK